MCAIPVELEMVNLVLTLTIERDSLKAELAALRAQRVPMTKNQADDLAEPLTFGLGRHVNIYALISGVEAFHNIKAQP